MATFVIERNIPDASKLTPDQHQEIASTSGVRGACQQADRVGGHSCRPRSSPPSRPTAPPRRRSWTGLGGRAGARRSAGARPAVGGRTLD